VWKKGYWGLVQGEKGIGHLLLLVIRLYWGALLILSGLGKLIHVHGVADYFSSLHLPLPLLLAYLTGVIELLGGISLFIGFLSRIFSLLLCILFATAYATAHKEIFSDLWRLPSAFIAQAPFLYLYASLIVLCFGPGLFSIDYWLEKRSYNRPL
jgi:putative oxidoreductase